MLYRTISKPLAHGFAALLALVALDLSAASNVYRCKLPDGSIAYGNFPCADSATAQDIVALPGSRVGTDSGATTWRCAEDAARLQPLQVDKATLDTLPSVPPRQRESLSNVISGIALGNCPLHGGDCVADAFAIYRETGGTIFLCRQAGESGAGRLEYRVARDGRVYSRKEQSSIIKVLNPYAETGSPEFQYDAQLDGTRIVRPADQELIEAPR